MTVYLGVKDDNKQVSREPSDTNGYPVKLTGGSADVTLTGSNTLLQGTKTVTTAGTRVQLNADQACKEVLVKALHSNTGFIYVGNASVSSSAYGVRLRAEESVRIPVANLNLVYLDSSVNGEGVSYLGVN